MSTALLDAPNTHRENGKHRTIKELQQSLGGIPIERIRLWPQPGTATVDDLIEANDGDARVAICELVDGTLVEKPMGVRESEAAYLFGLDLGNWNRTLNQGFILPADAIVRLTPLQGSAPDIAFYDFNRFPGRKRPPGSVPLMYPDFVLEVLSKSNTKKEMARKRREYFAAGTKIVWEMDCGKQIVTDYHDAENGEVFGIDDTLSGEDVLPGFTISIRKWLDGLTPE